jgi:hypothetical protein
LDDVAKLIEHLGDRYFLRVLVGRLGIETVSNLMLDGVAEVVPAGSYCSAPVSAYGLFSHQM